MNGRLTIWIAMAFIALVAAAGVLMAVYLGSAGKAPPAATPPLSTQPARTVPSSPRPSIPGKVPGLGSPERSPAAAPGEAGTPKTQPSQNQPNASAAARAGAAAGAAAVPGQAAPDTAEAIARFKDASIDIQKRMAEIRDLAKRADEKSIRTLMELGSADTYLNFAGVQALGSVKSAEVASYLQEKTRNRDPRIISAAVRSLAQAQGAQAVPVIGGVLAANRKRPDGYQDEVCTACVESLAATRSPSAVPALAAEFKETVGKSLQHDYGSQVVAALKTIGDPAAKPALEDYARWLQAQRDGMTENPMGQKYLDGKISEVKDAITAITGGVMKKD